MEVAYALTYALRPRPKPLGPNRLGIGRASSLEAESSEQRDAS